MFTESGSDSSNMATLDPPRQASRFRLVSRPEAPSAPLSDAPSRLLVRTLFISDIHLGCRHSQASALVELLDRYEPEQLYLVGDFIDGWKLKNRWRWRPEYDEVLQRLMSLKKRGAQLFYTPGNHDNFLRSFLANFGVIDIQDRFIHQAADGRRYVVMHGDQFDAVEQGKPWLSLVASYAYDLLLTANWFGNRLRGKKHDPYAFCAGVKRRVKRLVSHISDCETKLIRDARDSGCDGVICGHTHSPQITNFDGVTYLNTGDWVENCTALVEKADGAFELIRGRGDVLGQLPAK